MIGSRTPYSLRMLFLSGMLALAGSASATSVLYYNAPMLTDSVASFADADRPQYFADDFIVSGSPTFELTEIRWWGRYFEAGNVNAVTDEGTDNFFLQLYADTGSGPETLPFEEIQMGAVGRTQVATAGGVPLFEYRYQFTQSFQIAGDTRYFLSIFNDNGIDDPEFGMLWSTPSQFSDPRWWRTNESSGWNQTGFNTAFELTGAAPVPEPATAALMGLGLLGLAARRKCGRWSKS